MCKSTGNLAQARNRATSWHLIQEIYKTTLKKKKKKHCSVFAFTSCNCNYSKKNVDI